MIHEADAFELRHLDHATTQIVPCLPVKTRSQRTRYGIRCSLIPRVHVAEVTSHPLHTDRQTHRFTPIQLIVLMSPCRQCLAIVFLAILEGVARVCEVLELTLSSQKQDDRMPPRNS